MGVLAEMGFTVLPEAEERRYSPPGQLPAVGASPDLTRIAGLSRRGRPTREMQEAMAIEMTDRLALPLGPCRCAELRPLGCIRHLLPVQGWYLYEASVMGGALGHVAAGGGKTGVDVLLPMVVTGCKRAVLLIPPELRAQFAADYEVWSQHFRVPNLAGGTVFHPGRPVLEVIAYSQLSSPGWASALLAARPDVIIADEAQRLKDTGSVRTNRLLRHFCEHEGIRFFCHSGTLTTHAIGEFAHLSALALQHNSPVPVDSGVAMEWGTALDAPSRPDVPLAPPGALKALCEPGESARSGFRRRLIETPGVITTEDAAITTRLRVHTRDPGALPEVVRKALASVRADSRRPDGEELVEELEVATCCRQLAAGFFYRWRYPRGESAELIDRWFSCRQAWHRELRERLQHRVHLMDSPALCRAGAERAAVGYEGPLPTWRSRSLVPWAEVEHLVQPVRAAVWLDDFLVRDAVAWGRAHVGVIWYRHSAFGHRVAETGGFPHFGQGAEASVAIARERGDRTIVVSAKAHGEGKNLQVFSRALVANPPDANAWEQLLARQHRRGQAAEIVDVEVYRHTPEVRAQLDKALSDATYVRETTGRMDRLLFAERDF